MNQMNLKPLCNQYYRFVLFSLVIHTCILQVFQREELQKIADLCIKHDVICISDEACEWLTYDGAQHIKIGKNIRFLWIQRRYTCWSLKPKAQINALMFGKAVIFQCMYPIIQSVFFPGHLQHVTHDTVIKSCSNVFTL